MNGREIKNVLKTAKLLASRKEVRLGLEHIEIVLKIEKRHVIHSGEIQTSFSIHIFSFFCTYIYCCRNLEYKIIIS